MSGTRITMARVAAEEPVSSGDKMRLSVRPGRLLFFALAIDGVLTA